jgi:hypothetical protein
MCCCFSVLAADDVQVLFALIKSVDKVRCKRLTHHLPHQALCNAVTSICFASGLFALCAPPLAYR